MAEKEIEKDSEEKGEKPVEKSAEELVEEENKSGEVTTDNKEGKDGKKQDVDYNKQTKYLLVIMAVLLLSVIVAHFIVQSNKTFDYQIEVFNKILKNICGD